jgi:hypothetical protein
LGHGGTDGEVLGRTLADLGAARSRLQRLDDDFYVRGSLPEGRYRSIRVRLDREIDRLHVLADVATKRRIALHLDPAAFWAETAFQQQGEVVHLVLERVDVMPGRPGVGRFDPSRVRMRVGRLLESLSVSERVLRAGRSTSPRPKLTSAERSCEVGTSRLAHGPVAA